jgi:hypothetical protein
LLKPKTNFLKKRDSDAPQPGERWQCYPPTTVDLERIKRNIDNENLYLGRFDRVLERFIMLAAMEPGAPKIGINLFQSVTREFSKLLFSEDMTIVVPGKAQRVIDDIFEQTDMQAKLLQMSDIVSSIGGCPLKVRRDTDKQVHIDIVPNNIYFPSHNPDDVTALTGHTIAWERADADTGEKYIVREIHTPGRVKREVLDAKMKKSDSQYEKWYPDIPADVATGYPGMLVEYIPNYRYGGNFWGESDYDKIRHVVEEIMVRMSILAGILDKHAHPTQILPAETLDDVRKKLLEFKEQMARTGLISRRDADAMVGENDIPRALDAIYVPTELDRGLLPRVVTWDTNLSGAMEELDRLFDIFISLSCMTPEVFGISKYGVSESGRALKFRNMRALNECNSKRQFMVPGIKRIVRAALSLAGYDVDLKDIGVVIQDGMPFDEYEATQISSMWVAAGLADGESAMLNARPDITRQSAREEIKNIESRDISASERQMSASVPNSAATTKAVSVSAGTGGSTA